MFALRFAKCIVLVALLLTAGCGKDEIEKLNKDKAQLESKVQDLEGTIRNLNAQNSRLSDEIDALKKTGDYHYRVGIDLLSAEEFDEAKMEFETVINKYPASPSANPARQQLKIVNRELKKLEAARLAEERRRKEEEKYRPRSEQDAIEEWVSFRSNEEASMGKITTWRFRVSRIYNEPGGVFFRGFSGYLDDGYKNEVYVVLYVTYQYTSPWASRIKDNLKLKEKDWVIVTGEFSGISRDNSVIFKPLRIKNEGYQP